MVGLAVISTIGLLGWVHLWKRVTFQLPISFFEIVRNKSLAYLSVGTRSAAEHDVTWCPGARSVTQLFLLLTTQTVSQSFFWSRI